MLIERRSSLLSLMVVTSIGGALRVIAPLPESMLKRTKSMVMGTSWSLGKPPAALKACSTAACVGFCERIA